MTGKSDTPPPSRDTELEQICARLKAATEKLEQTEALLQQLQLEKQSQQETYRIVAGKERYYHSLFMENPMPMWIVDFETKQFLDVNQEAVLHYGYSREEFLSMTLVDIRPEEDVEKLKQLKWVDLNNGSVHKGLWRHYRKDGSMIHVEITSHQIELDHKKVSLVLINDITARRNAEEQLHQSFEKVQADEQLMRNAERLARFGSWHINLLTGAIKWSDEACRIYGYEAADFTPSYEMFLSHVHPDDREYIKERTAPATPANDTMELEFRIIDRHGLLKYIRAKYLTEKDRNGNPIGVHGFNLDVTENKLSELEIRSHQEKLNEVNQHLEKKAAELTTSNKELEQFAYVASHDLQEPLRMVSSFLQLLEKKYRDQVDETGRKYIHFAVDGANRMKQLIQDLLEYSRVGTATIAEENTNMNHVVAEVLIVLKDKIDEAGARIETTELPVLPHTRKIQMLQLMQNLVGNALKYRSDQPPLIKIAATRETDGWVFSIQDNGIGIAPRFADKVFTIFQRLHNKNEYSGTGIGLSICKKIVDQHGGKIWLESEPGQGSTFYFSLPGTNH